MEPVDVDVCKRTHLRTHLIKCIKEYEENPYEQKHIRLLMAHILPAKGDMLLDLGAGVGALSYAMAARGADVAALDISLLALELGIQEYGIRNPVRAQARALPFKENSFDGVCASGILELVADKGTIIAELRRVLKHGGRLVISTTYMRSAFYYPLLQRIRRWKGEVPPVLEPDKHLHPGEVRGLLVSNGFSVERVMYWNAFLTGMILSKGSLKGFWPLTTLIDRVFSHPLLCSDMVMVARLD